MDKNKIEIRNVYLIFGSERSKAFRMLKKGKSKNEILKETGCTIAVNNASLSVREGEIFVIMGLSGKRKVKPAQMHQPVEQAYLRRDSDQR